MFLVIRANPTMHFAPFLSTHFFLCLNPCSKMGYFCPSSPFDLPKCLVSSLQNAFYEWLPKKVVSNARRRLQTNTACAHLLGFQRASQLNILVRRAGKPAEGPKAEGLGCKVQGFREFGVGPQGRVGPRRERP